MHDFNIHSLSVSVNSENFITGDFLTINIYSIANKSKSYNVIDLDKQNRKEIDTTISRTKFMNKSDLVLGYSTSKGIFNILDLRINPRPTSHLSFGEEDEEAPLISQVLDTIHDFSFSNDD